MKKICSVIVSLFLLGSTAACGNMPVDSSGRDETAAPVSVAARPAAGGQKVLIAYFSRWGNTDYPAGVDATTSASIIADNGSRVGTTEYLANVIQKYTGGDVRLIQTEQPYPVDFNEVVDLNHQEMAAKYLPALQQTELDMAQYDTVFIGYPVWANTIPQAVRTFLTENKLQGKKIIPFCTHDGYSSGRSYADISRLCGQAQVLDGIAVEAGDVMRSQAAVEQWLQRLGIGRQQADMATALDITVGTKKLAGVLEATPLAEEIRAMMPLTVTMVNYGNREYYGGIETRPQNISGGSLYFENGDITYCPRNNTLAIFYAKARKDRPPLTMEVIKIGRVTSDLAVFDTLGSSEAISFAVSR